MKYQNSLRPPGRTCRPADTSIVIQTAWFVNPSEWLLQLAAARHDLRAQHAAVRHIDLVLQIDRRANMHRDRLQHIADLQLRHRPLCRDHAVLLRQAADAQLGILREPGVALKEIRRLIQLRVGRKRLAPAVHDHIVLVYAHNGHDQPRRTLYTSYSR